MTQDLTDNDPLSTVEEQVAGSELNQPELEPVAPSKVADNVQMVSPSPLGAIERSKALIAQNNNKRKNLMSMMDVPVELVMEVGRTQISVEQLMELVEGSIIDLRKVSVDSIEVRMNQNIIAQAEAIALQGRYGVRFTSLEKMANGEEEDGGES